MIVDIQLGRLRKLLAERQLELELTPEAIALPGRARLRSGVRRAAAQARASSATCRIRWRKRASSPGDFQPGDTIRGRPRRRRDSTFGKVAVRDAAPHAARTTAAYASRSDRWQPEERLLQDARRRRDRARRRDQEGVSQAGQEVPPRRHRRRQGEGGRRFKEITEAYETLGDEKKRAAVRRRSARNPFAGGRRRSPRRRQPFGGGARDPARGGGAASATVDLERPVRAARRGGGGGGFGDIFATVRRRRRRARRAAARAARTWSRTLEVDLPEAALGGEKPIDRRRQAPSRCKIPPGVERAARPSASPARAQPGAARRAAGRSAASSCTSSRTRSFRRAPARRHRGRRAGRRRRGGARRQGARCRRSRARRCTLTIPPGTSSGAQAAAARQGRARSRRRHARRSLRRRRRSQVPTELPPRGARADRGVRQARRKKYADSDDGAVVARRRPVRDTLRCVRPRGS